MIASYATIAVQNQVRYWSKMRLRTVITSCVIHVFYDSRVCMGSGMTVGALLCTEERFSGAECHFSLIINFEECRLLQ